MNSKKYNWSFIKTVAVLISSIIPFGTFIVYLQYSAHMGLRLLALTLNKKTSTNY